MHSHACVRETHSCCFCQVLGIDLEQEDGKLLITFDGGVATMETQEMSGRAVLSEGFHTMSIALFREGVQLQGYGSSDALSFTVTNLFLVSYAFAVLPSLRGPGTVDLFL